MIRIVKYLKPFLPLVVLTVALLFIQANCDLALPDYLSRIVNNGIQQINVFNTLPEAVRQSRMNQRFGYILQTGGMMLLIALLSLTCTIVVGFLSARVSSGLGRAVRSNVFRQVQRFSNSEFDRFSTASLITRTTNDITQLQMLAGLLPRTIFYAPLIGIGAILRVAGKAGSLSWGLAVAVLLLVSLVLVIFSQSLPRFQVMQALVDRLNLVMRENLSGMMVVRAFNKQSFEAKRFDKANRDLTSTTLFVNRVMAGMFPGMAVIMNGLSLLIVWVGAQQVAQAHIQVGDVMAFLQYAMQIVSSFIMMSFLFFSLPRASVSARRIADVLETTPSIRDLEQPSPLREPFGGKIEFRSVSFRYPGAETDVLHDLSFIAQPGQTTAFIGATGSGKSTVVSLIPRFYDVTGGTILIDDTDIRQVPRHDLRARIGYVPQKSTLFSGSIASNLRYADEAAPAEALAEALRMAQASDWIGATAEGMDSAIAQGGMNVSGGQKQRLAIARALVRHAPIMILDDSFSALDFKTDRALREALGNRAPGNTASSGLRSSSKAPTTLLMVSQRVSTIRNADQIIVLDAGKIVGKGTHAGLMDSCATYREIALSQLTTEELG